MRSIANYLHRYVGLALVPFLIVIGSTGCVIAFFTELDTAINPDLLTIEARGVPLSPLAVRDQLAAEDPKAHFYYVHFPEHADQSLSYYVEGAIDPSSGEPFPLDYDEVFADQYNGERLGERLWGNFSLERKDLITQLYFLHYSLVLPEALGEGFMGVVALIWAIDCIVALFLTLPKYRRAAISGSGLASGFWKRWSLAWKIKTTAGRHRLTYDVHRAVSLWLWILLLIVAVSGFAFNLPDAYTAMIKPIAEYQDSEVRTELDTPLIDPQVGWDKALQLATRHMAQQAATHGFTINRPGALIYRRALGVYYYRVHSSRDVVSYGETTVAIDATTGELVGVDIPTGHSAGNTFTSWIKALHTASVFGWPWKVMVSVTGIVVVVLSLTGVMIWWRKRRPATVRTGGQLQAPRQ